jgi:acetyl-CoA acetyltransferase family protein
MRDAVICEPLRTPVGGFGGTLRDVPAHELASTVIRALMERTGLPPESVDDVLLGNCYPSMDAPAIGRVAALDAGLPVTASGLQIDRRCGSGLQAVLYAAMQVQTGASEVVLAGGAESMSNASFYSTAMRWGAKGGPGVLLNDSLARGRVTAGGKNFPVPGGMIETAENLRAEYRIPREEQDEYAVRSHRRAAAATAEGRFADEIVPVTIKGRKSTSARTPARRPWPGCVRSWASRTRTPPSRPGTPPARTTAPRSASSPARRRRRSWGCGRSSGWCPGASVAWRRRRWGSVRSRRWPRRWTLRSWRSRTWI